MRGSGNIESGLAIALGGLMVVRSVVIGLVQRTNEAFVDPTIWGGSCASGCDPQLGERRSRAEA